MKKLELKCTSFSHKLCKYNSYKGTIGNIANNKINRRFTTSVHHQKITTDTTEFKIYNTDDNGIISINKAINITNDCNFRRTFHLDQDWAYQMNKYSKILKSNKIFQSMSRKGTCLDNSSMENFFEIMKQEMYYGKIYRSFEELKLAIEEYIYYYNNKRIKEKLKWCSQVDYRIEYESKIG